MSTIYIAAPGRSIPGSWPEDGRPIDPLSRLERNYIRDGDLIEKPAVKPKPAAKETDRGQ